MPKKGQHFHILHRPFSRHTKHIGLGNPESFLASILFHRACRINWSLLVVPIQHFIRQFWLVWNTIQPLWTAVWHSSPLSSLWYSWPWISVSIRIFWTHHFSWPGLILGSQTQQHQRVRVPNDPHTTHEIIQRACTLSEVVIDGWLET